MVTPLLGWAMMNRTAHAPVDAQWERDKGLLMQALQKEYAAGQFQVLGIELYFMAKVDSATRFALLMRELCESRLVWSANGRCDLSDSFALASIGEEGVA